MDNKPISSSEANSEPNSCPSHDSSNVHPTSSIMMSQALNFVDLAQVTSAALVEQLTNATNPLQTPTTSDSSVLISSSSEFNQYRDVDVQSLASSRRSDLSNASTARSRANADSFNRSTIKNDEMNEEPGANDDNVMASSDESANNASGSTTQTSAPRVRESNQENHGAENEIANITDIWIQEENPEEDAEEDQANASPVFSNEDSNSNQLDDASLQNHPHSQDHFSINSLNEDSYAENSNHSPSSTQQPRSQNSPQLVSQTLPQSTLAPMPLTGDPTSTVNSASQLSSQQPTNMANALDSTTTSTTPTSSNLNDTSARTSSILISNNDANETGSTNSISHYSIFTRIRSQPSTSQTNMNQTPSSSQPSQSSSSSSKQSLVTSSAKQSSKLHSKQSTFKFEPKNPSFHKLVEEYYKEFAEETDPLTKSSTLRDANQAGFSSINENYLAFSKLSKLFLRHENYYCTMFLPFNRVYKYKSQDEYTEYSALDTTADDHQYQHHHQQQQHQRSNDKNSKLLNSIVDKFKSD